MVIGIGIDVVPVARLQEMLDRHGERALHRLFTAGEIARAYLVPEATVAQRIVQLLADDLK